jgi:hypothetical protein
MDCIMVVTPECVVSEINKPGLEMLEADSQQLHPGIFMPRSRRKALVPVERDALENRRWRGGGFAFGHH